MQKTTKIKFMRPNIELDIIEKPMIWLRSFQDNFLAGAEGEEYVDWEIYKSPENTFSPGSKGINLSQSRLMFISIAGAYIDLEQKEFDINKKTGDYSHRLIETKRHNEISFSGLGFEWESEKFDRKDYFPVEELMAMQEEGKLGELYSEVVSLYGYQPNVIRVAKEVVPKILEVVENCAADAVYILPVSRLGIQTAGLISRALEVNGIATCLSSWDAAMTERIAPPRVYITKNYLGTELGLSEKKEMQNKVLAESLALLSQDAPITVEQK